MLPSLPHLISFTTRHLHVLVASCLMLITTGQAHAQGFVLDEGVNPVPIYYAITADAPERQIGEIEYRVVLDNGERINQSIDSFYFRDAELARLTLTVTVRMERPNNKKIKDLRVIFPSEAFGAMGARSWKYRGGTVGANGIQLGHGASRTFEFTYARNGVVNFNLPFVVAPYDAPANYWELPKPGALRNRVLSRQIRVLGILTEEEKMWRRGKDAFSGVAGYLRKYPRGKYEDEAGRRFTNTVEDDFSRLVLRDGAGGDEARAFIAEYTPFADFTLVEERLAEAKQVVAGAKPRVSVVQENKARPVRTERRSKRVARPPTPPLEQEVYNNDPGYRMLDEQGGYQVIRLYNFQQPAYYDIYSGVLDIDASMLRQDSVIRVRQIKQGEVSFLIVERDDVSRFVSINLNNLMEVGMTYDTVLGQYNFSIEGGIEPYQLYLRPLEDQRFDWGTDQIENRSVSIPLYDLQRAGLEGRYMAQVMSAGSARPLTLSQVILTIPKTSGNLNWAYPLLIAGGIGGVALLLLALLNRFGAKGGNRGKKSRARV